MTNQLNEEERAARKRAIDFARGSVRYEGFVLPPEAEAINARYIDGELSLDDYIAQSLACADALERNA